MGSGSTKGGGGREGGGVTGLLHKHKHHILLYNTIRSVYI